MAGPARCGKAATGACLVDGTDYLLRCMRNIDLNPVRARMTDDPTSFPWSSCAGLCALREDSLLTPNPVQQALDAKAYRDLLCVRPFFRPATLPATRLQAAPGDRALPG